MKSTIRNLFAATVAFAATSSASGNEADVAGQAGSPPPPLVFRSDAMIRPGPRGPFAGNDIYNQTGSSQTATTRIARGSTVSFSVRLQNDGNTTDGFLMKPGNLPSGYAVTYWQNGKNVTPTVEAGKFSTGDLVPGQSVSLVVKLFARMTARNDGVVRQALTLVSVKSPDIKDTVAIRAKLVAN